MELDIRTIALLVSIGCTLQSTIMFCLYLLVDRYRGIGHYTLGFALSAACFAILVSRGIVFAPLTMLLVNSGIIASISLLLTGLCRFVGRPAPDRLLLLFNILVWVLFVWLVYFQDDINLRVVVFSAAAALVLAGCAFVLLGPGTDGYRVSARCLGGAFALFAAFMALRAVVVLINRPLEGLFVPDPLQIVTFLLTFAFILLWSMGFTLMLAQRFAAELHAVARTDPLTGLLNRRAMEEHLVRELARQSRSGRAFTLVLLDVDHFKRINDRFGHDGGDCALRHLARLLTRNLRQQDNLARYGGEEFLLLLPDTGLQEALGLAERLRREVQTHPVPFRGGDITLTISCGVASHGLHGRELETLLQGADHALYRAKDRGRNRVEPAWPADRVVTESA